MTKICEVRLKFIEETRDELWRRKERLRLKRDPKRYSWEQFFIDAVFKGHY